MGKSAKQWDKFCKAYAKYPQRAMKEKGHSRTSEILRKLHVKKPAGSEQQNSADANVSTSTSRKSEMLEKLRTMKNQLRGSQKAEPKTEAGSLASST